MSEVKSFHRSTTRVLDILILISNSPGEYTMTEICKRIDSPKSSVSPILNTLVDRHLLYIRDGKYHIGYVAYGIGNAYLEQLEILDEIKNIMQDMTDACRETSYLGILVDGDVFYLSKIDSPEQIRMKASVGKRFPAYSTSLGKALLMDLEMSDLKKLYSEPLPKLTKNTITKLSVLYGQIADAKKAGFTYEIEESNEHIRCFAVPLRQHGKVKAAVSIALPVFRFTEELGDSILTLLFSAQRRIETLLSRLDTDLLEII